MDEVLFKSYVGRTHYQATVISQVSLAHYKYGTRMFNEHV
jgi:hypothetical protein